MQEHHFHHLIAISVEHSGVSEGINGSMCDLLLRLPSIIGYPEDSQLLQGKWSDAPGQIFLDPVDRLVYGSKVIKLYRRDNVW